MIQEVIILHGLPASGKSTWAKEYIAKHTDFVRINRDDLRNMFADKKTHHIEKFENFITDMQCRLLAGCLVRGNNVVIDDTNLSKKTAITMNAVMQQYCNDYDATLKIADKLFDIPSDECIKRDKTRPSPVGADIINKLAKDLADYKKHGGGDLTYIIQKQKAYPDSSKEWVIICDLDGTLALVGDRGVYDTAKCECDTLNQSLYVTIEALQSVGYKLILVTGRGDAYKIQTENWLKNNGIKYDKLLMRKQGDSRKDAIVKAEIYQDEIATHYYPFVVFDDRNQVVNMWRNMGLNCHQVNAGDF